MPAHPRPHAPTDGHAEAAGDGFADRFEVVSGDGTPIAVWVEGSGPPLVLVHGSIADHTTFGPLVEVLRRDLTTFSLDRRGFGASRTERSPYAIERDFEDVAAVVDAVAARTGGGPVALWGHSYGANCAMGGAGLTDRVGRLVLYEPSFGLAYPPGSIEAVEAAVARGDADTAITTVLTEIVGMTAGEIDRLRAGPLWSRRLADAHTVPRECRVERDWVRRPGQFAGIGAPTLLLTGSDSPPELVEVTRWAAGAIPDSRTVVLDGHAHLAHQTDPDLVAAIVRRFLQDSPGAP